MDTKSIETCQCTMIHEEVVAQVKPFILDNDRSNELALLFKVFGDATRIKILSALFKSEMCVCDLAATLGMTHSAISHQLRTFKAHKLVKSRKVGKVVYYSLADQHIHHIFTAGLTHILE
ncbi:MAG: ArsR/SmtB family transcription factor [Cellulosilyticaceae bacterium]